MADPFITKSMSGETSIVECSTKHGSQYLITHFELTTAPLTCIFIFRRAGRRGCVERSGMTKSSTGFPLGAINNGIDFVDAGVMSSQT